MNTLLDLARVLDGDVNPIAKEALRGQIRRALGGRYDEFLRQSMFSRATTAAREMGVCDVVAEMPPGVVLERASTAKIALRVVTFVLAWLMLAPMLVLLLLGVGLFEMAPRMILQSWQDLMGELVPPRSHNG